MKKAYIKTMLAAMIVLSGLLSFTTYAIADIAIIVNPKSGITNLTTSKAKKIFLAKTRKLPNGKAAKLVVQSEGSAVRTAFNEAVLGKSDTQYKAYWSRIIFSGKGSPPHEVTNDAAIKAYVVANENAIGYIDSGAVDDTVSVVLTVK